MVTTLMWNPKPLSFSVYHRRPVGGLDCVQLRSVAVRRMCACRRCGPFTVREQLCLLAVLLDGLRWEATRGAASGCPRAACPACALPIGTAIPITFYHPRLHPHLAAGNRFLRVRLCPRLRITVSAVQVLIYQGGCGLRTMILRYLFCTKYLYLSTPTPQGGRRDIAT